MSRKSALKLTDPKPPKVLSAPEKTNPARPPQPLTLSGDGGYAGMTMFVTPGPSETLPVVPDGSVLGKVHDALDRIDAVIDGLVVEDAGELAALMARLEALASRYRAQPAEPEPPTPVPPPPEPLSQA